MLGSRLHDRGCRGGLRAGRSAAAAGPAFRQRSRRARPSGSRADLACPSPANPGAASNAGALRRADLRGAVRPDLDLGDRDRDRQRRARNAARTTWPAPASSISEAATRISSSASRSSTGSRAAPRSNSGSSAVSSTRSCRPSSCEGRRSAPRCAGSASIPSRPAPIRRRGRGAQRGPGRPARVLRRGLRPTCARSAPNRCGAFGRRISGPRSIRRVRTRRQPDRGGARRSSHSSVRRSALGVSQSTSGSTAPVTSPPRGRHRPVAPSASGVSRRPRTRRDDADTSRLLRLR